MSPPRTALAGVLAALVFAQSASAVVDPGVLEVVPVSAEPATELPHAGTPVAGDERLALGWPAHGTLTDGFGPRWGRMHLGLDIGILRSLGVKAAASGVVAETGVLTGFEGYGQVVLVELGQGYRTMYAHLSRVDVRPGTWINRGERVGIAGCTGSCTGTHLHFELHRGGVPVDPMPFLAR